MACLESAFKTALIESPQIVQICRESQTSSLSRGQMWSLLSLFIYPLLRFVGQSLKHPQAGSRHATVMICGMNGKGNWMLLSMWISRSFGNGISTGMSPCLVHASRPPSHTLSPYDPLLNFDLSTHSQLSQQGLPITNSTSPPNFVCPSSIEHV